MKSKILTTPAESESYQDIFEHMQALSRDLVTDENGFSRLSLFLTKLTGVHLPSTKKNHALMANRLSTILAERKLKTYEAYFHFLQNGTQEAVSEFISALTTHTTHFFRENPQLELFREILPEYLKYKERRFEMEIRIWCAAASTGQEPYSLAIAVRDSLSLPDYPKWNIKILATDVDVHSLKYAANGLYNKAEIASLSNQYQKMYVTEKKVGKETFYQMDPRLQSMIRFAPLNLLVDRLPFQHKFDFVFCRNVLIYFDEKLANSVVKKMVGALHHNGYLFVGASESGYIKVKNLHQILPSSYQKRGEE